MPKSEPKNELKLNDRFIRDTIKVPASGRVEYWDVKGSGIGLRVSASGRKTWVMMYRNADGLLKRMTLGTYPELSLSALKVEVAKLKGKIADKKDPAAEKQARRKAETVKELVADYLEQYAKPNKKSWKADKATLERDVVPAWGNRKADSIKRRDVNDLLRGIIDRGAPIQANRVFEIIRKMFRWAVSQDVVEASPCYGISKPVKEQKRDRWLTEAEIKTLWAGLCLSEDNEACKMAQGTQIATKLILVTAQRPGEVAEMPWAELDTDWPESDAPFWTIPKERTKNGIAHRVPLSPLAVTLLKDAAKLAGKSPFAFPSPRDPKKPISGGAIPHAVKKSDCFGLPDWRPHDLRRTAATHMTGEHIGVSRFILERVLNHTDPSVTKTYDQTLYDPEKRAALNAWADRLEEIVSGKKRAGNVVPLKQGGQHG